MAKGMRKNKKAISVSIEVIFLIVIGIVAIGFLANFTYKTFTKSSDAGEEQLDNLLQGVITVGDGDLKRNRDANGDKFYTGDTFALELPLKSFNTNQNMTISLLVDEDITDSTISKLPKELVVSNTNSTDAMYIGDESSTITGNLEINILVTNSTIAQNWGIYKFASVEYMGDKRKIED